MMPYTREQIRSFIRCPQLGSEDYGEWGALRLEQKLAINDLLDVLDSADFYIKELTKEKDKLLELYNERVQEIIDLEAKAEQLEKENFELKQRETIHKLEVKPKDNFYEYYDFIPKSVIREKIEELNKEFKERTQDNDSFYFDYSNEYAHIEEVLKELLGEEK